MKAADARICKCASSTCDREKEDLRVVLRRRTAASKRSPRELLIGKWNFDGVRDQKVQFDRAKLATMTWELTPSTMVT